MKYEHRIEDVTITWRAGQTYIDIRDTDSSMDIIGVDEEPTLDEIELYAEGWIMNNSEVW